jgi:hypothetical protein
MTRGPASVGIVLWALCAPCLCRAVELWSHEGGSEGSLSLSGKATSLASHPPADPLLFPDGDTQTTLLRLRFGLGVRHSEWMDSEAAYEQQARWTGTAGGLGAGSALLPSTVDVPFRLTPIEGEICGDDEAVYRHEIDRGLVALHPEWGEVTVGRQAIGLGRGMLFGAADLFSPFSPLEVDREWRRGVDAVRAEYRLSPTSSAEVIGVFGESWGESALLGRLRGYLGEVDGSFLIGKFAEDFLVGGVVSTIVGDAEVHAEVAVFDTPEEWPDGTLWIGEDVVTKAVLGTSYVFDVGSGLSALAEYHYSGFGLADVEDALLRLQDPAFQRRFLRGDTQILGRHALAGRLSYAFDDAVSGGLLLLGSPVDGSGVASPSVRIDVADNTTLLGSVFLPWGEAPRFGQFRSEYGATATSLFLQANVYY